MTRVFVRGLTVQAQIGVYRHEIGKVQPLVVDVELEAPEAGHDRLSETVNYETILAAAQAIADQGHIQLVETYADRLAPVALLLQTYCRGPQGKHRCLDLVAERGIALPDTPPMAVHRGRIDLLEAHLRRDPQLCHRTFSHQEIYPSELGCHADHSFSFALHGTPLAGTTLLHMCVDFDEMEIARWLIAHGADVNARAQVDADGFGGQTPLFGCVVSQAYLCGLQRDAEFARLLLDRGANPNARASPVRSASSTASAARRPPSIA